MKYNMEMANLLYNRTDYFFMYAIYDSTKKKLMVNLFNKNHHNEKNLLLGHVPFIDGLTHIQKICREQYTTVIIDGENCYIKVGWPINNKTYTPEYIRQLINENAKKLVENT